MIEGSVNRVPLLNTFSPRGMNEIPVSEPEFLEYRQSQSFAHMAGFSLGTRTLMGTGDPLRLVANWSTSEFFSVSICRPGTPSGGSWSLRSSGVHRGAKQTGDRRSACAWHWARAARSNPEIVPGSGSQVGNTGWRCGLLAACILVRFMRSMLFEVGPYDPRTFWQPGRQCSQSLC